MKYLFDTIFNIGDVVWVAAENVVFPAKIKNISVFNLYINDNEPLRCQPSVIYFFEQPCQCSHMCGQALCATEEEAIARQQMLFKRGTKLRDVFYSRMATVEGETKLIPYEPFKLL
jgi:hypothetical protein